MIVLLHGVPETAALWRKVQAELDGPSVALAMPGFGCDRPDGFGATKEEYLAWLVGELQAIGEPVDLVGHDWGAILTYGLVLRHGDVVRSWAADCGNLVHPDYVWHAFAQIWQTPEEGEAAIGAQAAQAPQEAAPGLAQIFGIDDADALEMATALDVTMGACILDLYRSATPNPHASWGPLAPTAAPGLVLHATEDPFSDEAMASEVAEALGARLARLEGVSHFWAYQQPAQAVAVLQQFWSDLP